MSRLARVHDLRTPPGRSPGARRRRPVARPGPGCPDLDQRVGGPNAAAERAERGAARAARVAVKVLAGEDLPQAEHSRCRPPQVADAQPADGPHGGRLHDPSHRDVHGDVHRPPPAQRSRRRRRSRAPRPGRSAPAWVEDYRAPHAAPWRPACRGRFPDDGARALIEHPSGAASGWRCPSARGRKDTRARRLMAASCPPRSAWTLRERSAPYIVRPRSLDVDRREEPSAGMDIGKEPDDAAEI